MMAPDAPLDPATAGPARPLLREGVDTAVLACGDDLDQLLRVVLDGLGARAGTAVHLALADSHQRHLRVHAWAFADDIDRGPPPPDPIPVEGTTIGRAFTERRPVHVRQPDGVIAVRSRPGFRAVLEAFPVERAVAVPVTIGDRTIGVLSLSGVAHVPAFDDTDAEALSAMADRIAVIADHAVLLSSSLRNARRQDALATLRERALRCSSTAELFDLVTASTHAALDADTCAVFETEHDGTNAVLRSARGVDQSLIGTLRLPMDLPTVVQLFDGDPWVRTVDGNGGVDEAVEGLRRAFGVEASLTVALRHRHRRVGVLGVGRRRREMFSKGDEEFLASVAALVNNALEARTTQDRLRRQTLCDDLTGLPNRNLMGVRIQEAMARAKNEGTSIALLLADLDGFKVLNDSLGHLAGDHVLRVVAARLSAILRPMDFIARLGGDEFAVLCQNIDEHGAVAIAERMLATLTEPVRVENTEVVPRASIGVTVYDVSDHDLARDGSELLPQADLAMYRAKAGGRNRIAVYDVAMHAEVQQRLLLEQGLRAAIGTDQLSMHYQPIVRLSDGTIRSLEALVRWQHPTLGAVRPDQFVAVAEESDLIWALSTWVLGAVARQVVQWHTAGLLDGRRVAVNMSARDLTDPTFVDRFQRVLAEAGCAPDWLYVEVTETLLTDTAGAETVRALKQLGVHIALDDYGTGFSSLGQLKRVPVDVLKIDRSFVANLLSDPVDATIVTSTIALAHALGKRVVAEGIETIEQLHRLLELGCDAGQGYLFARPQPVDVVTTYLADGVPGLARHLGL